MIVTENNYSPDQKSENVQSSGIANIRLSKVPIGPHQDTQESGSLALVLSSKPSHKNNNLSKKPIQSLHPKKVASLMCEEPASRKVSPVGILKQPRKFSREQSIDSVGSGLEQLRRGLNQPSNPNGKRPEPRIHQSVTYSPVSHCITRDQQNIFEKKKLRMAKIQKLRGASN